MIDDLIPIGKSDSMFIDKKGDIYTRNPRDEELTNIANINDCKSEFVIYYHKLIKSAYEQHFQNVLYMRS